MGIAITATGQSIRVTANMPSPSSAFTALGWARLNTLGAGFFQTLFALESATSSAPNYASIGWLAGGGIAFDVVGSGSYTEVSGTGLGAGEWIAWFLQVDTVPATDSWTTGVRSATVDWRTQNKSATAAWSPAVMQLGTNSFAEFAVATFGPTKIYLATLSTAEIDQEIWRILPSRVTNLQRFSPFRTVSELTDYSGNGYTWSIVGSPVSSDSPPVSWGAQRVFTLPFSGGTPITVYAEVDGIGVAQPAATVVISGGGTPVTVNAAVDVVGVADPAPTIIASLLASGSLTNNPSNPLVTNGPAGYDALKAGPRHVVKMADNDYRMLYEAASDLDVGSTAYATSTDGTTWTKYGSNPVFTAAVGGWENEEASITSFFWDGTVQKWVAYFHGGGNSQPRQVGRATADSIVGPWTKYAGNPVVTVGTSGAWDDNAVADAKVILVGSTYHMFYNGNGSGDDNRIGHATSSDGITWTKDGSNPVLPASGSGWDSASSQSAGVWYDPTAGMFHMWYVGDNGSSANEALGYAYSADGTTWARGASNPVLSKPGPANIYIGDTVDVYRDGNTYRVLYGYFDLTGTAKREINEATITVAGPVAVTPFPGADKLGVADPAATVTIVQSALITPAVDVVGVADPAATVTALQAVTVTPAVDVVGIADPAATVSTGAGVTIAAAVDVVGVADPAATVTAGQAVTVTAAVDVIGIADPAATVVALQAVTFSAPVDVIGVADPQATVTALQAATVAASVDIVGIADPSVTVSVGGAVSVGAGVDVVAVAQPAVTVIANQVLTFAVSVDVVGVADPAVTVVAGIAVTFAAGVDALAVAQPQATVSAGGAVTVLAGVDAIGVAQPAAIVTARQAVTFVASVDVVAVVQFAPGVFTTAVSVTIAAAVDVVAIVQPSATVVIAIMIVLKAQRDLMLRTGRDLALDAQRNKVLVSRR